MKSTFFLLAALFAFVSAAPLLFELSTLPASTDVASLTPTDGSSLGDSFALPDSNSTTPESESISGSDPAQLDSFLSGDGEDGDSDLSDSTFSPSDLLGQLGLSQDEIAQAQAQAGQQGGTGGAGGGSTGGSSPSLEWPSDLGSLGSTDSTPASDAVPVAGADATAAA
ncbi:hypothetical protein JCM6882_001118 [Rhodosporidiobolus microsporus]